ncbi:MAG: sulfatase-like hydrolase/transferase [Oceanipulchritudo sp.]
MQNPLRASISLCLRASLLLLLAATALSAQQPNIILFYVDDLGYGDLGSFWQDQRGVSKQFDTPALDKMAAEGAKLTHHYTAAPVCAPARASLLQGRHQGHAAVRDNQFDNPLPDTHTLPGILQAAGYRTIHVGKGGLSGSEGSVNLSGTGSQNLAAHPLARGFDRFFGYLFHADGHEHYPRNGTTEKTAYIYDDYQQVTNASLDLYTTDAWTAFAKQAIIDEVNDGDSQPFFLYLAYDTPHFKMQRPAVAYPGEDLVGGNHAYGLTGGIQWTTATDGSGRVRYASTADGTGTVDGYTHPDIPGSWTTAEKQHVGMIRRIDNSVADILQLLDDLGIDNNTICVFSSDNGPHNEGNDPRSFESYADMEGIKRDVWEAGIRVPTIVRWPGNIAGATNDENNIAEIDTPSGIWDWMPTFAEAAGVTAPAWCDGVSLLPALTGSGTQRDKGYLYFEYYVTGSTPSWSQFPNHGGEPHNQMQAIRIGDHMGVRVNIGSVNDAFRIYDVTTDPGQAVNLAGSLPALEQQMRDLAIQARRPGAVSRSYIDNANVPAVDSPPAGTVSYSVHEGTWTWVPEFRDLPSAANGTVPNLDLSVRTREDNVGILFTGYIEAPTTGTYTFYLDSDNGSNLFIHDGHVVENDTSFTGAERTGSIKLGAGWHPFRLYYRHTTGVHSLSLQWSGPGISKQAVPDSAFEVPGTPTNPEPVANDDTASVLAGSSVLINVLANDSDDGLPAALTVTAVDTPLAGSALITGNQILYTPDAGFYGTDVFTYTISDSQTTASATVTVDVIHYDNTEIWLPLDHVDTLRVKEAGGQELGTAQGFSDSATPWVDGHSGKAIQLNGSSQSILLDAAYTPPTGSSARTVTAWIKATGTGAIAAWGPKSTGNKWHWRLEDAATKTGALRIEVEGGYMVASTDLRDNEWHHVAVVLPSGANNVTQCRLYVNGVEDTPYTSSSQTINTTAAQVEIGKDNHNTGPRYFQGAIDEVRIYKRALSSTEIAAQAALGNQAPEAWHRAFFGPDAIDWAADGDADGFNRFMEMALGGNPHLNDRSLIAPLFGTDAGTLSLTFRRRMAGSYPLTYTMQVSTDLSDWNTLTSSQTATSVVDATGFLEQATFQSDSPLRSEPRQMLRLKVERP